MFQISLEAARVNAKLTQKEAARSMKVNPVTLSRWEKGETFPNAAQFRVMCDLYKCPMDAISMRQNTT